MKTGITPFPSTSWTLVMKIQKGDEREAAKAMEEMCRSYWYPIYAFARRSGFTRPDAEDLTQVFFQNLTSGERIKAAQREKGKLRSFMLMMLKRVMSKQLRHETAAKRGGKHIMLSFDDETAEERYALEPADINDPVKLFDHAWAQGVLSAACGRLREEFLQANNLDGYEQLREFLPLGDNATPYPEAAARLGINESSLRVLIHRMRKRYARLIEAEIAQTVSDPAEQKAELVHLMAVVGR